jgi:hypothetical protein
LHLVSAQSGLRFNVLGLFPSSFENDVFLQIEQIIPLPETEEYMIEIKEKQKELSVKSKKVAKPETALQAFWKSFQLNLEKHGIDFLANVSVGSRFYTGFGRGAGYFAFSMGRETIRVELFIAGDEEKRYIDALLAYKTEIESSLDNIIWQRLDNKKASRLKMELPKELLPEGGFYMEENWPFYTDWFRDSMMEFYKVVNPIWEKVQKDVK